MKNSIRMALAGATLTAALAFIAPSAASAQWRPHGGVSIGFAGPRFVIGAVVPTPWVGRIWLRPGYGYGFACDAGWVPVRSVGGRWIVGGAPVFVSPFRPYRHHVHYRGWHRGYRFDR